ncbi:MULTISPECIES: DsbA family oxidoreductase [Paenibacillus]|uniref:DsbA family oxidoreductase n=2 Tax=Paenibacillus validus TaxID=44253 RepID=A0A7X2ZBG6_9BACL|nr:MULTISPECIES: DsbA family oxidoreductase [Paenibacillus]MUG71895.1 DsbA family oxidoreductase [Paenibacillus validus]
MQIDVYSDMVCPWCRIGKQNLKDALAAWSGGKEATIRVRSFQLDPSLPPEGLPFHDAMGKKMGGPAGVAQVTERVTQAGAAVGVTFRFDRVTRMPSTLLAHRLVALLPEDRQAALVDGIMKAYFEDGQDIAQLEVLLAIAAAQGHAAETLRSRLEQGEGAERVNADQEEAARIGVTGVPFFVFDNKYALSGAYPAEQMIKVMEQIVSEAQG